MECGIASSLARMARQEKALDALYRQATASFGLADCTMWVLYYLVARDEPLTQQDLVELMMFPKQTINSAVAGLVERACVELEAIPGTRNRKRILLTPAGEELARDTVGRIRHAEERAVGSLPAEAMERYLTLSEAVYAALQAEFAREGLLHHG